MRITVCEFCVSKTRFHKKQINKRLQIKISHFFRSLAVFKFAVPIRLQSLSITKRGLGNFNNNKLCPD